jgi:D-galactose 1-dehydrogenase
MLRLRDAELFYPSNCETPIAARAAFDSNGAAVQMELDFLHRGTPSWNIHVDTDGGQLGLLAGGSVMEVDGRARQTPAIAEYPALYAHFAGLVRSGASEVDLSPLQLVADAFLCGRRTAVEPFIE